MVRKLRTAKKALRLKILPRSGHICVAVKPIKEHDNDDDTLELHWYDTRKKAMSNIKKLDVGDNQVYIAQASFNKEPGKRLRRKQIHAAYLRNFFMDIDCGKDKYGKPKPYATKEEGIQALKAFCMKTVLPEPAIVDSGNGLYAHWPLSSDVKADDWKVEAKKLKKLVKAYEPGLDKDGLITDTARILRPIGSTHRKEVNEPKRVTKLRDCAPIEFEKFKALLDKAIDSLPSKPLPSIKPKITNDGASSSEKYSADKLAENCPVIGHIRDTRGNVSEPLWYAGIGVLRHCKESPNIIHEWSSGYSDYTPKETNDKIAQHSFPPTTCEHFAELAPELCNDCKHRERIKSPILLGIMPPIKIPEFVAKINSNHFISRYGGRTVVCREAHDPTLKRKVIEMSTFSDFKNFYDNKRVSIGTNKDGTEITLPLGKAWLQHEGRRQYDEIKMLPEGDIEGVFNLWRGFTIEPAKGSWELMKKHIRYVICDGNKKLYRYVLGWLARMIQEPWTPGEVALVLQGIKGVGKGKFVTTLCRLLGQHSMQIFHGKHLSGNFNAHLEDCILLYVDEAFWAGDKAAEGVLKGIITEPTLPIERKTFDLKTVRNMLHIVMASNNDWVVPASVDERRYCVLKVSDSHAQDHKYFAAIDHELDNGGLEAMLYYLKTKDISEFNVRAVPQTDALILQKLHSLDPLQDWWLQKLRNGELLPGYGWDFVPTEALFDDFISSTQKVGRNTKAFTPTSFGMQLPKLLPKGYPSKKYMQSAREPRRVNHYQFPDLNTCRKKFQQILGVDKFDWRSSEPF